MRNLHIFGLIAAATLGAGIVACTTETTTGSSSGSTSSSSSSGSSGSDGGVDGATSSSSSSGSSGSTRGIGIVSISQTEFAAGPTTVISASAFAAFSKPVSGTGGGEASCKQTKEGACTITECDLSAVADGGAPVDAGSEKDPNAGEITLSGGDIPAEGIKLAVEADGSYKFYSGSTKLFSSGQTITTKAAGADVPAFEKGVAAPAAIKITSPACATAQCGDLDSTKDFDIVWTDGGAGKVTATATTLDTGKKSVTLSCVFDSSANKGTVPAAALGKLIKGAGNIVIGASSNEIVAAGNYDVSITVATGGVQGTATVK